MCFVEITYPRTENWSLEEYAGSIEQALDQAGIHDGWLLGESFGSQVAWEIVKRGCFAVEGLVLAGGFARHPAPWMAQVATFLAGKPSLSVLRLLLRSYAHVARFRFRHSPETLASIDEFIERRTELDWCAIRHRLKLVAQNDPRTIARDVQVPVYAVTGFVDPIVPWHAARKWLLRHCRSLRGHRVIWRADHNVLGTAAEEAAEQVLAWIRQPLPGLRLRGRKMPDE